MKRGEEASSIREAQRQNRQSSTAAHDETQDYTELSSATRNCTKGYRENPENHTPAAPETDRTADDYCT